MHSGMNRQRRVANNIAGPVPGILPGFRVSHLHTLAIALSTSCPADVRTPVTEEIESSERIHPANSCLEDQIHTLRGDC